MKKTVRKKKRIANKSKRLWKKKARERAKHRCEYTFCASSSSDVLDIHHIVGKRMSRRLKWDIDNALVLCRSHHTFGRISAHSTDWFGQKKFNEWLESYLGEKRIKRLEEKRKETVQVTLGFLERELRILEGLTT